jgi:hypothetical protein
VGRFIPDKGLHYLALAFVRRKMNRKLVLVGGSRYDVVVGFFPLLGEESWITLVKVVSDKFEKEYFAP